MIMKDTKDAEKEMSVEIGTDVNKIGLPLWQSITVLIVLLIIAFLLGLVPAWLSAREVTIQRDTTQANLRLSQLQNRLATATIRARNGDSEIARLAASDFFTDLRAELDRPESALDAKQQGAIMPIMDSRDKIITLLARDDPAAIEGLTNLYLKYQEILNPPVSQAKR